MDLEDELVGIRAAGRTMSGQISAAEERVKPLKAWLAETQFALEKLKDESSSSETEHRAELSFVKEVNRTEKTRVERLKRELATEVEKRRQLFAELQETSKAVIRQ